MEQNDIDALGKYIAENAVRTKPITKSDADHPWGGEYIPDDRPWPKVMDDEVEAVVAAARKMPRETPLPGASSTIHDFKIAAHAVWGLDDALTKLDAMRAAHVTAQQTELGAETCSKATPQAREGGLGPTGYDQGESEAMAAALMAVVQATRSYLPGDGIDARECISRILDATDNAEINPVIRRIEQGRPR